MNDLAISKNVLQTVIVKAMSDPAFKARLLENANGALAALGVEIPQGMTVRFVENTPNTTWLVLPAPGKGVELTDELLAEVAGGVAGGMIGGRKALR